MPCLLHWRTQGGSPPGGSREGARHPASTNRALKEEMLNGSKNAPIPWALCPTQCFPFSQLLNSFPVLRSLSLSLLFSLLSTCCFRYRVGCWRNTDETQSPPPKDSPCVMGTPLTILAVQGVLEWFRLCPQAVMTPGPTLPFGGLRDAADGALQAGCLHVVNQQRPSNIQCLNRNRSCWLVVGKLAGC